MATILWSKKNLDNKLPSIMTRLPSIDQKLNANTMDNCLVLTFEALHIELIQKWHKVHKTILIKHAFCNFVFLEPWT